MRGLPAISAHALTAIDGQAKVRSLRVEGLELGPAWNSPRTWSAAAADLRPPSAAGASCFTRRSKAPASHRRLSARRVSRAGGQRIVRLLLSTYRGRDSNPHRAYALRDFKSLASAVSPPRRVLSYSAYGIECSRGGSNSFLDEPRRDARMLATRLRAELRPAAIYDGAADTQSPRLSAYTST